MKPDYCKRFVSKMVVDTGMTPEIALEAVKASARRSGDEKIYKEVKNLIQQLHQPEEQQQKQTNVSPMEALSMILDAELSVEQYEIVRQTSAIHHPRMYPCYDNVYKMKDKCRPPEEFIEITERKAEVQLQALMNHTAQRTVEYILSKNPDSIDGNLKFFLSGGFDGTGMFTHYNQRGESVGSDASIFVACINRIMLSSANKIIWLNPTPGSYRYVRPFKLFIEKETKQLTISTFEAFRDEISKLQDFEVDTPKGRVLVSFDVRLTMLDGKCISTILDIASTHSCTVCKGSGKALNDLNNFHGENFAPNEEALDYSLPVLHSWLRGFDALFNLACHREITEKGSKYYGMNQKERKTLIQQEFWKQLSLEVNNPRSGGGTSTTGNVCRRAFTDPEILANILELNVELITNFRNILVAISCMRPLNYATFQDLCLKTAQLWVELYPNHNMTPTVHKLLIHGPEILRKLPVPAGYMSEEASEACNKYYRRNRENHARKTSRVATTEDMFYRQLDNSDPVIASFRVANRLKFRRSTQLPKEVENLLVNLDSTDFGAGVMFEEDIESYNEMQGFLSMFDDYNAMETEMN